MNTQRFMPAMLIAASLTALSCIDSELIQLSTSTDIPAAQGTIRVSTTDNGNTQIDCLVEHLALPQSVNPDATIYVVWLRANDVAGQPQNLGALKVDEDLKGSISAMTPLRSFELFITAEPSRVSTLPTSKKLLYANVAMK